VGLAEILKKLHFSPAGRQYCLDLAALGAWWAASRSVWNLWDSWAANAT